MRTTDDEDDDCDYEDDNDETLKSFSQLQRWKEERQGQAVLLREVENSVPFINLLAIF